MKPVNQDPVLDIRKAMINGMCRIGMEPDKRLIDAVVDSLPDFFRQPLTAADDTNVVLRPVNQAAVAYLKACGKTYEQ